MSDAAPTSARRLIWIGSTVILAAALARATVRHDPLPGWTMDPTAAWSPLLGVGPAGSIALDTVALFGAAAVLLAQRLARRRLPSGALLLFAIGALPALWHALLGPDRTLDDVRLASAWIAALGGALALREAARDAAIRRTTLAVVFGFAVALAGRGVMQVFVEHAGTVQDFNLRRDAILRSHGWEPGSSAALIFERRLTQPEASGWFGLSNVYAGVLAACFVGLAGVALASLRRPADAPPAPRILLALPVLGALAAGAGLLFGPVAGCQTPKGAVAAAALGIVLLSLPILARRLRLPARMGVAIGLGVVAAALAAVIARGLIGERIGELSILFRWFYLQGAVGIFADAPLLGVGPDGFKTAYLIHRPPLSPEEVASPHSVLFDWLATLGVGAAAWAALWLAWVAAAGRRLLEPPHSDPTPPFTPRSPACFAGLGAIAIALGVSFVLEELPIARAVPSAAALLALESIVRLLAWGVAWAAIAGAALAFAPRALDAAAPAAALALASHAQIELTMTTPGSAALAMLVIAAASAPRTDAVASTNRAALAPPACAAVLASAVFVFAFFPALSVERHLRAAARAASVAAEFDQRALALHAGSPQTGDSYDALALDLGVALGRQPPRTAAHLTAALAEARLLAVDAAAPILALAADARPSHPAIARSLARLYGHGASLASSIRHPVEGRLVDAERAARDMADRWSHRPESWSTLASVLLLRAELLGDDEALAAAVVALERGASLDPHGVDFPFRLAEVSHALGRTEEARRWAAKAVEMDALKRLDPLAGLSPPRRQRIDELLGGS